MYGTIINTLPKDNVMCKIHRVIKNPNRLCNLSQIWKIAENHNETNNIPPITDMSYIKPPEKKFDIIHKKNMSYAEFDKEYGVFVDTMWESSNP